MDRLVPEAVAVFEVLSPASGRNDRIDKLREYQAVSSIRHYIIMEFASVALQCSGARPIPRSGLPPRSWLTMF